MSFAPTTSKDKAPVPTAGKGETTGASGGRAKSPSHPGTPVDLRRMLNLPEGPNAAELANFRSMAQVKIGFEEMSRNMQTAASHPAAFDKYKESWNTICDLLEEVAELRKRNAELNAENDIILDLVKEVGDLRGEIARLEGENAALKQDNEQTKETLHSKISAIAAWVRIDGQRARAQAAVHGAEENEEVDAQTVAEESK